MKTVYALLLALVIGFGAFGGVANATNPAGTTACTCTAWTTGVPFPVCTQYGPTTNQMAAYTGQNKTGTCLAFPVNTTTTYYSSLADWDNIIQSVWMGSGARGTLYSDPYYTQSVGFVDRNGFANTPGWSISSMVLTR